MTLVSWLLVVLTAFYYNFRRPEDGDRNGHKWHRHTIWGQNRYRHTPFSLNPIIGGLYWYVDLSMQSQCEFVVG
jgi:hypothetical protein